MQHRSAMNFTWTLHASCRLSSSRMTASLGTSKVLCIAWMQRRQMQACKRRTSKPVQVKGLAGHSASTRLPSAEDALIHGQVQLCKLTACTHGGQ